MYTKPGNPCLIQLGNYGQGTQQKAGGEAGLGPAGGYVQS